MVTYTYVCMLLANTFALLLQALILALGFATPLATYIAKVIILITMLLLLFSCESLLYLL